jgi:hypothetical protein
MKGKALLLILLVIFVASLSSFALNSIGTQVDEGNRLRDVYSISPIYDDGEGVEPQGIPIDTPGMPG